MWALRLNYETPSSLALHSIGNKHIRETEQPLPPPAPQTHWCARLPANHLAQGPSPSTPQWILSPPRLCNQLKKNKQDQEYVDVLMRHSERRLILGASPVISKRKQLIKLTPSPAKIEQLWFRNVPCCWIAWWMTRHWKRWTGLGQIRKTAPLGLFIYLFVLM